MSFVSRQLALLGRLLQADGSSYHCGDAWGPVLDGDGVPAAWQQSQATSGLSIHVITPIP